VGGCIIWGSRVMGGWHGGSSEVWLGAAVLSNGGMPLLGSGRGLLSYMRDEATQLAEVVPSHSMHDGKGLGRR
jgi:hypothetical protein